MEIADKEDEIVFCDTESMEQQKARSRQRNGLGIEPVGVALGHIHNVGSRPPGCRSWSGGCNELACGGCRMQCGHAQNRLWARQYWRYVPPSFPFLRKFPKLPLLGGTATCIGTAVLLPRAKVPALGRRPDVVPDVVPQAAQPVTTCHKSTTGNLKTGKTWKERNYLHSATRWCMMSFCPWICTYCIDHITQKWRTLKVMYWKVIGFLGGPYRFTAFRACPMSFSTPPYWIGLRLFWPWLIWYFTRVGTSEIKK